MTEAELLHGAWLALEQAGRLLDRATTIFDSGDPATAVVLAMFGREEVGRYRMLRQMADKAQSGRVPSIKDVQNALGDHATKQRASQLSTTLVGERGTVLGDALHAMLMLPVQSEEYGRASDIVEPAMTARRKRAAHDRHALRERALYVDVNDNGTWSRPADLDFNVLQHEVFDAINDYAVQRDKLRDQVIDGDEPAMAAARKSMPSEPLLLVPRWPKVPHVHQSVVS